MIHSPFSVGFTWNPQRLPPNPAPRCRSISSVAAHVPATRNATKAPITTAPRRPSAPRALRLPPNFNSPPSPQRVDSLNTTQPNRSYPSRRGRRLKTLAVRPGKPVLSGRKSTHRTNGNEQKLCSPRLARRNDWIIHDDMNQRTWMSTDGQISRTGFTRRHNFQSSSCLGGTRENGQRLIGSLAPSAGMRWRGKGRAGRCSRPRDGARSQAAL